MATMGRPLKPEGEKQVRFNSHLSPDQRERLGTMATSTHRSMAQVLEVALDLAWEQFQKDGKL